MPFRLPLFRAASLFLLLTAFIAAGCDNNPYPAGESARNVLYLENWAVEIESGRVLWCKPDLDPVSPLIPIADERAVYTTNGGELVCLRGRASGPL